MKTLINKYLFLLVILCFSFNALTQSIIWNWAKHIKRTNDNAQTFPTHLFNDSEGNNFLIGRYSSSIFFDDELLEFTDRIGRDNNSFIAKYDKEGQLLWAKKQHIGKRAISAAIDSDDIIHVFARDSILTNNIYWHEQYDSDWNKLSATELFRYTVESSVAFSRPQIAIDKADNRYFLFRGDGFGTISFLGLNDTLALEIPHNYFLLKYDANGNLEWWETLKAGGFTNIEMAFNSSDELTLAGAYAGTFSVQNKILSGQSANSSARHIFCLQFTKAGNLKWARKFKEGVTDDSCRDLVIHNDFLYLTGVLGFGTYDFDNRIVDVVIDDPYLLKLDNEGDIIEVLTLPLNIYSSEGSSIAVTEKEDIIWIGRYTGNNAIINGQLLPNDSINFFNQNLFYLLVEQSNGFKIKSINTLESEGDFNISTIQGKGNDEFIMAGYFAREMLLGDIRFESDFFVGNRYDLFLTSFSLDEVSSSFEEVKNTASLKVFPNPNYGQFTVELPNEIFSVTDSYYEICDLQGKLLVKQPLFENVIRLPASFNQTGVFCLKIRNKELFITKKIVVYAK